MTRDRDSVIKIGFPVFSKGYNSKDVRKRATLDSYNRTICIDGVSISPSDLIFADNDGVVVIPANHEREIIQSIIEKVQMENEVATEIARSTDPMEIVNKIGEF